LHPLTKTSLLKKDFPKKKEEKFEFRINQMIRVPEVRLVGDNLEVISRVAGRTVETGVYQTRMALQWAEQLELDLVEISPNAEPPVCKIIDYRKFIYDKKKREKELKAKVVKTVMKEIRFGPNTDEHDFEFKVRHAKNFLDEGAKVRAYVHFRGRTIVFKDRGELLLLKFLKELEDHGAAEALPKLEGRRMSVIITPKKKK
jgi:translation initiation factor IF-3